MQNDKQEIDTVELERLTNEAEGFKVSEKPQTNETEENLESKDVIPEITSENSEEIKKQSIDDFINKVSSETPYKTIEDLISGYKSSQSEITKFVEKVKPYEQLIQQSQGDTRLRSFIEQAVQLYNNPQLAQSLIKTNENGGVPNPNNYDFSTEEGLLQFQQDTIAYSQKAAFDTVNQKMYGWEQQQQLEQVKSEFRQKYPAENSDEVIEYVKGRNGKWTLEDAYKIKNYENLEKIITDKVRKEFAAKVNEAGRNSKQETQEKESSGSSVSEIIQFLQKFGLEKTTKKYGEEKVRNTIQQFTNENEI